MSVVINISDEAVCALSPAAPGGNLTALFCKLPAPPLYYANTRKQFFTSSRINKALSVTNMLVLVMQCIHYVQRANLADDLPTPVFADAAGCNVLTRDADTVA